MRTIFGSASLAIVAGLATLGFRDMEDVEYQPTVRRDRMGFVHRGEFRRTREPNITIQDALGKSHGPVNGGKRARRRHKG